jgi:hypothetical protein
MVRDCRRPLKKRTAAKKNYIHGIGGFLPFRDIRIITAVSLTAGWGCYRRSFNSGRPVSIGKR